MRLTTEELSAHRGEVTMVDGGFDPLHAGHVEYLRQAAEIGPPVLCNLAPDGWIERKHPILLAAEERVAVIDSIRYVSFTHVSGIATVEVLDRLRPRYYVKGADWHGRLPASETEVCEAAGIEVIYLDTVLNSSSGILRAFRERLMAWEPE